MNLEKLQEVLSDEAFVKSLFALETAAEVQAALQEKGVELTEEEILSVRELLLKVENGEVSQEQLAGWQLQAADGELSEEALEQVAGGIYLTTTVIVIGACIDFLIAGAVGTGVGIGIADAIKRRW